jgi:hypothetical protein
MFSTLILSALAMMPSAFAQSSQPIQGKVPFAFSVQGQTMDAGEYRLTYSHTAGTLHIRGLDWNSESTFAVARPADASNGSATPKLVFDCYGKSCYLAKVWQGRAIGSLEVPEPEHGRKLSFSTRAVTITIPAK